MEYIELNEEFPLIAGPPRSPGLHVSQIIKGIEEDIYKKKYANWKNAADVGFIWEELLSLAYRNYAVPIGERPGEVERDGIIGSPDAMNFNIWRPEEFKFTWRSAKKTPDTIWKYMTQVKAYLKMLDAREMMMRVLYANGFYDGKGPVYKCGLVRFDRWEIDDNWRMLVNFAKGKGWL
jgi:hypothetical protein